MDVGGINAAGIATANWANVTRSLTQVNGFGAGMTIQPFAQLVAASLTAVATTAVLTYSLTGGVILAISVNTSTALGAGSITSFLDIILDTHTLSIPLYSVGSFDFIGRSLATNALGAVAALGNAQNDSMNFTLQVGFNSSVTIQLRITASTLASGNATITVVWAHP